MNCGDARKNLSAYIDGELSSTAADALLDHLSQCADCTREFEQLKNLVMLAQTASEVDPPSYLAYSIMQAAAEGISSEDCETCRAMLSSYIDGELSSVEESCVRIHIALCSSCSSEVAALSKLSHAASSIQEIDPPSGLRERIAAVTTRRKSALASILSLLAQTGTAYRRPVWTAVGVIVLTLGVWLISHNPVNKTASVNITPSQSRPNVYTPSQTQKPAPEISASGNQTAERVFSTQQTRRRTHTIVQKKSAPASAMPRASHVAELPAKETETVSTEPSVEANSNVPVEDVSTAAAETVEPSTQPEQARPKLIKIVVQPIPRQEELERIAREVKALAEMKQNESDKVKMDVITKRF